MRRLRSRLVVCCINLSVIIALGGCGKTKTPVGSVSGTVTFQGEPVPEGQVSFYSKETGKGNIGSLDSSGKFSFPDPVEVGTYTVFVTPPEPPPPDIGEGPQPAPKQYPNIPEKSRSELTSPLTAEVEEGENSFTFELE